MSESSDEQSGASANPPSRALNLTDSSFRQSRAEGPLTFSVEQGKHELEVQIATHQQAIERQKTDHELEEARKENDARRAREAKLEEDKRDQVRVAFRLAIGGIIGVCVLSVVLIFGLFGADSETATNFGYSLVSLITGGFIGYFTGVKSST